jgi:hypothetical protein
MALQSRLLRAFVVAALVAGIVTAAFHLTVSERYVDRAIALEEHAHEQELHATGATVDHHEEVFSRRTQKAGLLVGTLVYAIAAGAIVAGLFALLADRLPGRTRRERAALFVGAALVTGVVVPFLKYPANPPGVGDPDTLARRQLLFAGLALLSIAGLWLAARLDSALRRRTGAGLALAGAAMFFIVWTAAVLLLLPGRTDPVHTPPRLLWEFRAASLAGQLIFWGVFGVLFARSLGRAEPARPVVTVS